MSLLLHSFQRAAQKGYAWLARSGVLDREPFRSAYLGAYFSYKRHWEDPFSRLTRLAPFLFQGGDILDIGANVGFCGTVFAEVLSPGCWLHAFEPEKRNVSEMKRIFSQRGLLDRCHIMQTAVGAEVGEVRIWINPTHPADHRVATQHRDSGVFQEVPMTSIDRYWEKFTSRPIAFIKIDVQGFEPAVCEGMRKTLDAQPNVTVALEYMPPMIEEMGQDPEQLLRFFQSRGMKGFIIHRRGELEPVALDRVTLDRIIACEKTGYLDLLFTHRDLSPK